MKTYNECYSHGWNDYSRALSILRFQKEAYGALTENIVHGLRESQEELKYVFSFLNEKLPKIEKIFAEFPPSLETLRSTPLDPAFVKNGKAKLIDLINEQKVLASFQSFKTNHDNCLNWCSVFEDLKKQLQSPSDPNFYAPLPSLDWKGQNIDVYYAAVSTNVNKVQSEINQTKKLVSTGNPRISSSADCYQGILFFFKKNLSKIY